MTHLQLLDAEIDRLAAELAELPRGAVRSQKYNELRNKCREANRARMKEQNQMRMENEDELL